MVVSLRGKIYTEEFLELLPISFSSLYEENHNYTTKITTLWVLLTTVDLCIFGFAMSIRY